jgi:hypothetical protein
MTARPRPSVRAREGTAAPRAETESVASGSAWPLAVRIDTVAFVGWFTISRFGTRVSTR